MRKTNLLLLAFAAAAFALTSSCKKEELPIQAKSYHFDKMGELLEEKIGPGCVGLQYTITKNGYKEADGAIGKRHLPVDGLDLPFTLSSRKSVHSCSKTITAAALMHALEVNNVSLGTSILDYLPARWPKHDWIKFISFRDLLQHKSGLRGTKDSYNDMRFYIGNGPFETDDYVYANVNYSLMRILIPMINDNARGIANMQLVNNGDAAFDQMISESYINYVRNNVLVPAGVSADVGPYIWDGSENLNPTRCYNFSDQSISGYTHSNSTLTCGAGGWYLNTTDYAAFLAYLFGDQLANISPSKMMNERTAMFFGSIKGVEFYNHNGAYTNAAGAGGRSLWMHIPSTDVNIVIQINSAGNAFTMGELYEMVIDSYLESYF